MKQTWKKIMTLGFFPLLLSGCSNTEVNPRSSLSFYKDGAFESKMDEQNIGFTETVKIIWELFVTDNIATEPKKGEIPVNLLTTQELLEMPDNSVVRFAHSTLLYKLDGRFILTDPVFSERASPLAFFGPKRFHELPIVLDQIPEIDILILSHNHYDHFDETTLKALKTRIEHVYTTIGIKAMLLDLGYEDDQVTELDWWEGAKNKTIKIVATPAQHFSGRGVFDRNKTLWASWVIKSNQSKLFFGADSGYFDGFKKIGEQFGPFDMTFLENGAYNERWRAIHMMPEEAVQAHKDLNGEWLYPIHNGSFKLAMHPWKEPFQRIKESALENNVKITTPIFGEIISIKKPETKTPNWWK